VQSEYSILVTGPESTGKSTLSKYLSQKLEITLGVETAREYLNKLKGKYDLQDVENIARQQYNQENLIKRINPSAIFDTGPFVLKVWLQERFNHTSSFVEDWIFHCDYSHILLCKPDIAWQPDLLREHPTDRERLFHIYQELLEKLHLPYYIVDGEGDIRQEKVFELLA
jgi:nicotinamide riboside kinase